MKFFKVWEMNNIINKLFFNVKLLIKREKLNNIFLVNEEIWKI